MWGNMLSIIEQISVRIKWKKYQLVVHLRFLVKICGAGATGGTLDLLFDEGISKK